MKKNICRLFIICFIFFGTSISCSRKDSEYNTSQHESEYNVSQLQTLFPENEEGVWYNRVVDENITYNQCFEGISLLQDGENDPEWFFEGIVAKFLVEYKKEKYILGMRKTKNTFYLDKVEKIEDGNIYGGDRVRDFSLPILYKRLEEALKTNQITTHIN